MLGVGEQHVPGHRGMRNQCILGAGGYRRQSVRLEGPGGQVEGGRTESLAHYADKLCPVLRVLPGRR